MYKYTERFKVGKLEFKYAPYSYPIIAYLSKTWALGSDFIGSRLFSITLLTLWPHASVCIIKVTFLIKKKTGVIIWSVLLGCMWLIGEASSKAFHRVFAFMSQSVNAQLLKSKELCILCWLVHLPLRQPSFLIIFLIWACSEAFWREREKERKCNYNQLESLLSTRFSKELSNVK